MQGGDSAAKLEAAESNFLSQTLSVETRLGSKFIEILKFELSEYFKGKRKEFSVPLILVGSDFQIQVWNLLQQIHYGSIQTYKQQALKLNNLGAIRAMAQANGRNPLAILVPCHRVIGVSGKLIGYNGGI